MIFWLNSFITKTSNLEDLIDCWEFVGIGPDGRFSRETSS